MGTQRTFNTTGKGILSLRNTSLALLTLSALFVQSSNSVHAKYEYPAECPGTFPLLTTPMDATEWCRKQEGCYCKITYGQGTTLRCREPSPLASRQAKKRNAMCLGKLIAIEGFLLATLTRRRSMPVSRGRTCKGYRRNGIFHLGQYRCQDPRQETVLAGMSRRHSLQY